MKLVYFASVREALGVGEETLELPATVTTVAQLIEFLAARGDLWQQTLKDGKVLCAVDQEVAEPDSALGSASEVAFFPPVTGG